jgi:hypothetical protein
LQYRAVLTDQDITVAGDSHSSYHSSARLSLLCQSLSFFGPIQATVLKRSPAERTADASYKHFASAYEISAKQSSHARVQEFRAALGD